MDVAHSMQISNSLTKTACGRIGCIILYTGQACLFCDVAKELLSEAISQFGVSDGVICKLDVDKGEDKGSGCNDVVTSLPTVRICNVLLEGIPDEGQVNDAVIRALMMECFCDAPVI